MALTPLSVKKKLFRLYGSWYSNCPARTHGFNAKIRFKKYAPSPELFTKKCPTLAFQTKPAKFDIFLLISQDSVHIFQNRFLHCWNRWFKPVVLSTMNPINWTKIFLSYKGSFRILKRKSTQLKFWKFYFFKLILVLYI